jgi:hypothetical protein
MHAPGAGSALAIDAFGIIIDAGRALLAFRRHSNVFTIAPSKGYL